MPGARVNNHVGVGGSVALQTATGIIRGKRDLKVRALFDCGAHRSFVTKTTKDIAVSVLSGKNRQLLRPLAKQREGHN